MARTVRDHKVESRTARQKLPARSEPYWTLLSEGFHLGYYHGRQVAKWVARYRPIGKGVGYTKATLGEADDTRDADGVSVLDYRQAQDAARNWERELRASGGRKATYTVSDALDDYLAAFDRKDLANTRRRIEQLIRPAIGHVIAADLKAKQIRQWMRDSAETPARLRTAKLAEAQNYRPLDSDEAKRKRKATVNRDWTVLRAALNQAFLDDLIPSDAEWRKVQPFQGVDRARLRYLTDDEARRLVNAVSADLRPLVQASLLTGARYGELRQMEVRDFDSAARVAWLRETKASVPRPCYLEGEGAELFTQRTAGKASGDLVFPGPTGARWNDAQQTRRMVDACTKAKISPASFHDLRRTFGARLARKGVPMTVIAEALGHADERITRRHYAHLSPSHVSGAVRKHTKGLGIVKASNVVPITAKKRGRAA